MKKITLISQGIILLALIPIGVVLAQPRPVEPAQATVAQPEVVAPVETPQVVEQAPVQAPVTQKTPEPVVEQPVVAEPATIDRYNELLRQHGYESRFNSGGRSTTMYMFTYKLAEQYPERFTVDNVDESIAHIHSVFSNTPDPEWANVYLNFPW